jgi:hypothetical protein
MSGETAWENVQQQPSGSSVFPESLLRVTQGLGSEQVPTNVSWKLVFRGRPAGQARRAQQGRREIEIRWREGNTETLRRYAGEWIALEGERIIAHGPNAARVAEDARNAGVAVPYLFRVESGLEEIVPIGL